MGGLVQPPPAARAHRKRTAGRSRSALLRSEGGTCPSRVIQAKMPPRNPARFTALIFVGLNLAWEITQLPLYTIWWTDPGPRIAFAVLHCTAGDLMIGAASLAAA